MNTVVMRSDVGGTPTFREVLERVRRRSLEIHAHQDLPFARIVDELKPQRSLSYPLLFQVLVAFQNPTREAIRLSGLMLEPLPLDSGATTHDLVFYSWTSDECWHSSIEYNTDLFDAPTIVRFWGHLETLLAEATAVPDKPAWCLRLLSEPEESQLHLEWGNAWGTYPATGTIHDLFRLQTKVNPDAVAVVCGDHFITFGCLDRQSDELAESILFYLKPVASCGEGTHDQQPPDSD